MSVTPHVESAREAWAAAEAEDTFWREHYDGYRDAYPDQFVAVAKDRGEIVAADQDLDRVIDMLSERGLDVRRVWVRYVAATPIHLAV